MGYDINRFENSEINEEFICSICKDVLQKPLVIIPCDHKFCYECINQWKRGNCPIDREPILRQSLQNPPRSFMNLRNELKINCCFLNNGCNQYVKLGELKSHTDKCTFNPQLRTLCECGLSISTKELIQHQNDCVDYLDMQFNNLLIN